MNSYYKRVIDRNQKRVNIIRDGSLSSAHPKYEGPIPKLKIPLKEHQKTLLAACLSLEDSTNNQHQYRDLVYQSNIGIIGDNVGAGKSLSALALVAVRPKIENYKFPNQYLHSSGLGLIIYENNVSNTILNTNLLIVPHSVITQWEKYIKDYTNLTYQKINTTKSLIFSLDELNTKDIFLVSNNFSPQFEEQCKVLVSNKKFLFQRVFIDEADNIKITHGTEFLGLFNWFITSSVENLLFPDGQYNVLKDEKGEISGNNIQLIYNKGLHFKNYIRLLFNNLTCMSIQNMDIFYKICCKNNNDYIDSSFQLPLPNVKIYRCKTPKSIQLFSVMSNKQELEAYINANNIEALKEKLGFNVESNKSLTEMLTAKLQKTLHNETMTLEYLKTLEIDEGDKKERMEKVQKKIADIQSSIDYVEARINDENMCPICHDNLNRPICSLICCGQLFCLGCITEYFNHKKNYECPCCRGKPGFEGITILDNEKAGAQKTANLTKKEEYIKKLLAGAKADSRWLIFSGYDETFNSTLVNGLIELGITYSRVCGTVSHIDRVIKDFTSGAIRVLLLNAQHFGMGLNLEVATDLLIYHKLETELEIQVIGRAQRPGRQSPLNIHLLCHDNEVDKYGDRFVNVSIL